MRNRSIQLWLKRSLDVLLAFLAFLVALPLLVVTALVVRASVGSPVLFCQKRPGLHGHPFRLCKFRTMSDRADAEGNLLPDEQRLNGTGRFLRRYSLDELPELFNVLKGDMSLVGPRPLLMEYLDLYTPEQARRHEMRPGITGLAQIKGRNALSWDEKFRLDVWYVDNWSLGLDLRILAGTVGAVISGAGVSQEGHATTERFRGPGG